MPFTSTKVSLTAAFAGMLYDNSPHKTESFYNADTASMPFGTMLAKSTAADNAAINFSANSQVPIGVLRHSQSYAKPYDLDAVGVLPAKTLGVLVEGNIYVVVGEAVTPASPVRIRGDANAGANTTALGPGCFCTTTSVGHTILISKSANFLATTTGAGIVPVKINMTGAAALLTAE